MIARRAWAVLALAFAGNLAWAADTALDRAREHACRNGSIGPLARACAGVARDPRSASAAFDLAFVLATSGTAEHARALADELAVRTDLGPWGHARLELLRGWILSGTGRRQEAGEHYARALAALRARPGAPPELVADALVANAAMVVFINRSAVPRAEALLDEADAVLTAANKTTSDSMSYVLNQRTMLASARDDWEGARRYAERELELVRRLEGPDSPEELHALATLASITSTQRRYADALVYLEQGRRIGLRWPQARPDGYLGILDSLIPVLNDLGQPTRALEIADEAIHFVTTTWGDRSLYLVSPLERRAGVEQSLGRFAAARATYERVLQLVRADGAQLPIERRLRTLDSAGAFFLRMNDIDAAQRLLDEASSLLPRDDSMKYWRGRWLRRAATLAAAERRWADADALLERAQPLLAARIGASNPYLSDSMSMRCLAQLRGGMPTSACAALVQRLPALAAGSAVERMGAHDALAEHAQVDGRLHDALHHALQGLAASANDQSAGRRWMALNTAAGSLVAAGQSAHAVLLAKAAVEHIESARDELAAAPGLEPSFLRDKHAVYRRLADWLAEAGRIDEALAVLRLLESREYVDFVRGRASEGGLPGAGRMPYSEGEQRWRDASPLAESTQTLALGPAVVQHVEAAEQARAERWRQALARPVELSPITPDRTAASGQAARLASRNLGRDELAATVFLGARHVNVVIESARGRSLVRVPGDTAAIVHDTGRLLAAMERREDVLPLLQSLYARVVMPIDQEAQRVRASRLRLRVDGELRYLPFGALHDGKSHLITRLAVQQVALGSATGTDELSARLPWVQAFGSTRAAPGLSALKGVMDEMCSLVDGDVRSGESDHACTPTYRSGILPGQGWLDDAFTAQRLHDAAASGRADRFDLLHIGSHFVLRPGEIGASWLQLGDGTRLPLHDMLRWSFASQDLITLAACQTGMGGGAEVAGMASLLLRRGAAHVVSSLWPVDDRSTSRLVTEAYRHLRSGQEPAKALRDAQLDALKDRARAHPYHWAAFTVTSAGR